MDPNVTLRDLRDAVHALKNDRDGDGALTLDPGAISQVIDLFTGLDDWMSRGGFAPEGWMVARR